MLYSRRHRLGDVSFISFHSSERTTINGYVNAGVDADPTAGGQGVQSWGLSLARVRGVPLAGEALRFGDLLGGENACNLVASLDCHIVRFTRW